MQLQADWALRGYFDFSNNKTATPSKAVRDELAVGLGLPKSALLIRSYPVGPAWRFAFWWREGNADYAEAQFFMGIPADFPLLSIGLSVEKGRESTAARGSELMNRKTWDWPRLVTKGRKILDKDIEDLAAEVQRPINFRITLLPCGDSLADRTFSFVGDKWYARHSGLATTADMASYLKDVDHQRDRWAIAQFSIDLAPTEISDWDTQSIARTLLCFNKIRRKLRGVT
jgi:hypothetical protein